MPTCHPIADMDCIPIPSLDRIDRAAARFMKEAGDSQIIAFRGEIGAGKTTFIQAICRQLGVKVDVTSPTFALINEYFTPEGEPVYHFDLFRMDDPAELYDLGYEEYFYSGWRCFIEWPEKASSLIPPEALLAEIRVKPDGTREICY